MEKIPILTAHLFLPLEEKLISLLRSLTPNEWNLPTIAGAWTVKDVAAHLLDGNLRTLSMKRDQYIGDPPSSINNNTDLVAYLNRLNADWVRAMKRLSPTVLVDWMEETGKQFTALVTEGDPFADAIFAVSWAGESVSQQWFHVAREYTERWHHQQQIRDAVDKPGILEHHFYYPVLDTFMRALPYTYSATQAAEGTVVQVSIRGEGAGNWFLTKKDTWVLSKTNDQPVAAHCSIDGAVAWKLFTKSWRPAQLRQYISIEGDTALAEVALGMISVMA
ncbi:MAG TPA: maleylpyruvate isomerase N-terminal domain-containing protein [Chitinophagaceae bacterium]|nr:maleylpyruvate isomerase N-terminal domain-containing protein [Chitinophagaceae bacterium]